MAPKIESQRPDETAAEFTARLMVMLEESRRREEMERRLKEEERRQKEEAQRQKEEAQRQKEEAQRQKEEAQRQKEEAQRQKEEAQRLNEEAQQKMQDLPFLLYVDSMEDLVFSSISIERAASKVSGMNPTDVGGKMYPRSFRPWAGFSEQHAAAFEELSRTLGNEPRFKSSFAIQTIRDDLCRRPSLANETDTRHFVDLAIETPVSEIITAYLNTVRPSVIHDVHFQNNAYKKLLISGTTGEKTSPTKELQPDRWCFVYEIIEVDGDLQKDHDKTMNILVGEIKPPFKLRASALGNVLSTLTINHDTFFGDAIQRYTVSEDPNTTVVGGEGSAKKRVPGHVRVAQALCQAYHYMIGSGCQYGYISSGESLVFLRVDDDRSLCYYSVSFLVPEVDNAEERRRQNRGRRQPHETAIAYLASLCLWASRTTTRSPSWIDFATQTALRWPKSKNKDASASLGVLHIRKPGDPGPDDENGPESGDGNGDGSGGGGGGGGSLRTTAQYILMPSRPQKRNRSPERHRQNEHGQPSQRDKDWGMVAAPTLEPSGLIEPPTLPYCTQACLRGLVRGQALDNNCPNVALHRDARLNSVGRISPSGIYLDPEDDLDTHPLTASALQAHIVAQLSANMDKDCQCIAPHANKARYGKFFKLAVTGFGYTFVGKGVRAASRKVLEHEAVVYNAVPHLQGFLIPVFLGIIDLERSIPLPDLVRVTHIMLMSYAGPDLSELQKLPSQIGKDIDIWSEMERSTMDLLRAGIDNPDVREPNVAWNAEVQRVMHFDFDRVDLSELPTAPTVPKTKEEDQNKEKNHTDDRLEAKRVKTEPDGPETISVRSPLISMTRTIPNAVDNAGTRNNGDILKRQPATALKTEK